MQFNKPFEKKKKRETNEKSLYTMDQYCFNFIQTNFISNKRFVQSG